MSDIFLSSGWPVTRQVSDHLKSLIRDRGLPRGAPLPSYRELSAELGVAYVTVKRAVDALVREGVVHRVPAKGCFVSVKLAPVKQQLTNIGLIAAGSRDHLFRANYVSEILRGIMLGAQPDIDVHLFSLNHDGLVQADQIGAKGVNGVLLLGVENDAYIRTLAEWGTPGVVVDYCAGSLPLDCVACDNKAGVHRAVQHLAELGHRRLAYIGPGTVQTVLVGGAEKVLISRSSDVSERHAEVACAAAACGLTLVEFAEGESGEGLSKAASARLLGLLRRSERPTAILTYDDTTALRLMELLDRHGVPVPGQVSVCAVAGASEVIYKGQPLTYCRFDFLNMGESAVKRLKLRCARRHEPPVIERTGCELIRGMSTGTPAKG